MCGQLAAAAFDRLQIIELLLETFGVPPSELLIASGLDLCFACEGRMSVRRGARGILGHGVGKSHLSLQPWPFQLSAEPGRD